MLGENLCWLYCMTISCRGGFTTCTFPSPLALKDESDDGSGSDNANEDEDASSLSDDEMST